MPTFERPAPAGRSGALILTQLGLLGEHADSTPVTVAARAPADAVLAGYRQAGVERIACRLPVEPQTETLEDLDALTAQLRSYR